MEHEEADITQHVTQKDPVKKNSEMIEDSRFEGSKVRGSWFDDDINIEHFHTPRSDSTYRSRYNCTTRMRLPTAMIKDEQTVTEVLSIPNDVHTEQTTALVPDIARPILKDSHSNRKYKK